MTTPLGVSDAARRLGVRPAQITQLFYERRLRDDLCPIVAGRRLISAEYIAVIAMELRRKGINVHDPETIQEKTNAKPQEV